MALPKGGDEDLLFDSHFESGNLFAVFKVYILVVLDGRFGI